MLIEAYSNSDTSLELECKSNKDLTFEPNLEEVNLYKDIKPKLSVPNYNKYKTF